MADDVVAQRSASSRQPMVGWYDPGQLARTGVKVLVSTLFGQNADFRLMEALAAPADAPDVYDHTALWADDGQGGERIDPTTPRPSIWIDYVADVGDGWDSTYAIAFQLAQPTLEVVDSRGMKVVTQRGDVLVFGGDEVYPTASRADYQARLVNPYEAALRETTAPHPHAFAVPGNHDWYDSLVAFTRLFCGGRWFGGWKTQQARSYFAIKLPQQWWLVGPDVQLGSDVDGPQVEYFKRVAARMAPGDQVILCNAEPHWIYSKIYGAYDASIYNESNLAFLENQILGRKASVFLAGDLHHYRRHEADDGTQKITAGGGGAFLHPTHGSDVALIEERDDNGRPSGRTFRLRTSWPDPRTSRRLCWRNLFFPWINPCFGLVPALLYLLLAWSVLVDLSDRHGLSDVMATVSQRMLQRPGPWFLVLAVLGAFVLFTDTHSRVYRWTAGPIHGMTHLLAILLIGWGVTYLTVSLWGLPFGSPRQLVVAGPLIVVTGWLVSGVIMGLYLLISLNVFGRHANEAFSSLRIPDWKHFLRLRIDATGALTIFPIGIQRVPRHWGRRAPGAGGVFPAQGEGLAPRLIEDPIVVGGNHGRGRVETRSGEPTSR